ncbi:MAG: ABC transporter ATP-binding protein/permease [Clostridia bacterium]|nr:ABC transporter ATP-binding protein/permease [Clostridia bacterium]
MIKINSLFKTYKSKNKTSYHALNDVSLTLPDNGLIFLLGKSGSGKSTFLNIIGGLDSCASGSIIVDNKDLLSMKKADLTAYRSDDVGFVFQDYCLIDEFTVCDNIAAAITSKEVCDKDKINQMLKSVGLDGYGGKYPAELSGGERQRVAILRAIIKNPRIVLADEPTGNLDGDATKTIFDLLKAISKKHLVLVASHDSESALKYADRIIILEKGRVVSDSYNQPEDNDTKCEVVPYHEQINGAFCSSKNQNNVCNGRIRWLFLKSKLLKIALYSFIVSLIMIVMMLAQTITAFDSAKVMKDAFKISESDSLLLTKALDNSQKEQLDRLNKVADCFPRITDSDIIAFRDAGYDGRIYPVLKCNIDINRSHISAGMTTNLFEESTYVMEPLGVMIVEEDFLKEKYGKLEYVARADSFHPTGVIITDYLADSMLQSGQLTDINDYDGLIGEYHWGSDKASRYVSRGYINGIIETGYKEKYKKLLSTVEKYGFDYIKESLNNEDLLQLADDIHTRYGLCYSLNPNFEKDALDNASWDMVWHYALRFGDGDFFTTDIPQVRRADIYGINLGENEVLMEMATYNRIFNKQYTAQTIEDFVPHTETLSHYLYSELNQDNAQFVCDVTIVGLFVSNQKEITGTFVAGEDIYNLFAKSHIYTTGLYFDKNDNLTMVIDTAAKNGFRYNLIVGESVETLTEIVEIFAPIFRIMAVVLYISIVFILMNFASKMINDKMKEIGILKALGIGNRAIGAVFGIQIWLIALVTVILSVFGYSMFVNQANDLLINSLRMIAPEKIIPGLTFFDFRTDIVLQNSSVVFILALISYIVPMLRIRALDPLKIIRTEK